MLLIKKLLHFSTQVVKHFSEFIYYWCFSIFPFHTIDYKDGFNDPISFSYINNVKQDFLRVLQVNISNI